MWDLKIKKDDIKVITKPTWFFIIFYLIASIPSILIWYKDGDLIRVCIWSFAIVMVAFAVIAIEIVSNRQLKLLEQSHREYNKHLLETLKSIAEADISTEQRTQLLRRFEESIGVKHG